MKEDFLSAIDANLQAMGYSDRSQFIRTAVLEKLGKIGIVGLEQASIAPSRAGKGGRPKKAVDYTENQDEVPLGKVAETAPKKKRRKEP